MSANNADRGALYGGFWIRLLALLADSAVLTLVGMLILAGAAMALGEESFGAAMALAWLVSFLYWPLFHASRRQATPGKALLGMKVTTLGGGQISLLRSLGRELAKIPSSLILLVGFLMAAFTGRKQALHDLIASTLVTREGPARVVPALALAVAGFAAPFFAGPILVGDAAVAMLAGMVGEAAPPKPPAVAQVVRTAAPKPVPAPLVEKVDQAVPEPAVVVAAAPAPAPAVAPQPTPAVVEPPAPAAVPTPITESKAAPIAKSKPAPKKARATPGSKKVAKAARPKPTLPQAKAPAMFQPRADARPRFNDLMTAVLYRDPEAVEELLKLGKWPDKPDSRGQTPLAVAVELGESRSAEALLKAGADPAVLKKQPR